MTNTLLSPANIELRFPDRDWPRVWNRLNSGVLLPLTRECMFFIIHDRVFTRERGYRLNHLQVDSPYCVRCIPNTWEESIEHRYCSCIRVCDSWDALRSLLESLDSTLLLETDLSIINLCYQEPMSGNATLWMIGEYIVFIEKEVIMSNKHVSGNRLMAHLRTRWMECSKSAIPSLQFIPALFRTGNG